MGLQVQSIPSQSLIAPASRSAHQRWYRTLAAKKGWRVAKVALARKLVTIAYDVLSTEQDFAEYLTRQGVLAG